MSENEKSLALVDQPEIKKTPLEEGWDRVVAGEAMPDVIESLDLHKKDFTDFVRLRVREIAELTDARHKGLLLARLDALLASIWDKRKDDPKWAKVCLEIFREHRELVLGKNVAQPVLGEVIDMEHVRGVVQQSKERRQNRG